jgi:hypothetical protein
MNAKTYQCPAPDGSYHGCPDFLKGKRRPFNVIGTDGKASQPQQWPGKPVKARCKHEAYFLAMDQFKGIGPCKEVRVMENS